ncbi:hypothetical protein L7815_010870 [Serratia marcescens]|uniref:hypothetical protein n=1 Tax=Serratia marcescens TaxID=615 RepID=UPI001EE770FC|nr:hypothetical protein [Serratia marcescens]MCG5374436.1 hypothetical protein [Serratia marcescens]
MAIEITEAIKRNQYAVKRIMSKRLHRIEDAAEKVIAILSDSTIPAGEKELDCLKILRQGLGYMSEESIE